MRPQKRLVAATTFCFGKAIHVTTLRRIAWLIVGLLCVCCVLLIVGAIWSLVLVIDIPGASCCLPLQCNSSGTLILPMSVANLASSSSSSITNTDTHTDNGLCNTGVTPEMARQMGCFTELSMIHSPFNSNCSILKPSQCRNRASFPSDLAIAAASLGFAAVLAAALFVFILASDEEHWNTTPFGRYKVKFPLTFLFFGLAILSSGAGMWTIVQPLNVAMRDRQVEMEPATSGGSGSSSSAYTSSSSLDNVFLGAKTSSSPVYFAEGCGALSGTRAQLVGFLKFPTLSGGDIRLYEPLTLLIVSHGLVFFWTVVCLALSWHTGGLLNVLLWDSSSLSSNEAVEEHRQREADRTLAEHVLSDRMMMMGSKQRHHHHAESSMSPHHHHAIENIFDADNNNCSSSSPGAHQSPSKAQVKRAEKMMKEMETAAAAVMPTSFSSSPTQQNNNGGDGDTPRSRLYCPLITVDGRHHYSPANRQERAEVPSSHRRRRQQ